MILSIMWYVYILECSDNSLYTGITKDLDKRIYDHNHSKIGAKYTKGRRPVKLVWNQKVKDRNQASRLELEIKKFWKEKKEELISLKKIL